MANFPIEIRVKLTYNSKVKRRWEGENVDKTMWLERLTEKAKYDPYYQQCLTEVRELEPIFGKIRSALPVMQQKALDAYITACEELDHALLLLAANE